MACMVDRECIVSDQHEKESNIHDLPAVYLNSDFFITGVIILIGV
jgi:hypothetical protein